MEKHPWPSQTVATCSHRARCPSSAPVTHSSRLLKRPQGPPCQTHRTQPGVTLRAVIFLYKVSTGQRHMRQGRGRPDTASRTPSQDGTRAGHRSTRCWASNKTPGSPKTKQVFSKTAAVCTSSQVQGALLVRKWREPSQNPRPQAPATGTSHRQSCRLAISDHRVSSSTQKTNTGGPKSEDSAQVHGCTGRPTRQAQPG